MKKAIKLLNLVNEHNFLNIYLVTHKQDSDYILDSIAFLTEEEAESYCDYLNKKHDTDIYRVYKTCAHV